VFGGPLIIYFFLFSNSGLFGSGSWPAEPDGSYFIDRNPRGFEYLLDYLRNGSLNTRGIPESDLQKFLEHCDFFCVPPPQELVEEADHNWVRDQDWASPLIFDGNKVSNGTSGNNVYARGSVANPKSFRIKFGGRRVISFVGLSTARDFYQRMVRKEEFFMLSTEGDKVSKGTWTNHVPKSRVSPRSLFEVRYESKNIRFIVDGVDYGVAFVVPADLSEPLYPFVQLGMSNPPFLTSAEFATLRDFGKSQPFNFT